MNMKRLIVALAALTLVAGACGADSSALLERQSGLIDAEDAALGGDSPAALSQPDGIDLDQGNTSNSGSNIEIITNVNLSLVGDDPKDLHDRAMALATAAGGFVSNAQLSYPYGDTDSDPFVSLTL